MTLIGEASKVTDPAEVAAVREIYMTKHPGHFWTSFGDFDFFRMTDIKAVRYNGGFARFGALEAEGEAMRHSHARGTEASPYREGRATSACCRVPIELASRDIDLSPWHALSHLRVICEQCTVLARFLMCLGVLCVVARQTTCPPSRTPCPSTRTTSSST